MTQRVHTKNPNCEITSIEGLCKLRQNMSELLAEPFELHHRLQVTASSQKPLLMAWCKSNKRSVITIGGAGGQTEPTKIQTADLG